MASLSAPVLASLIGPAAGIRAYLVVYYSALIYGFACNTLSQRRFFPIAGEGFGLHQGMPVMAAAIARRSRRSPSHQVQRRRPRHPDPALARSTRRKRLPERRPNRHRGLAAGKRLAHASGSLRDRHASLRIGAVQFSFSTVFPTVLVQIGWTLRGAGAVLSSALIIGVIFWIGWFAAVLRIGSTRGLSSA
jgi:hypothetical protein